MRSTATQPKSCTFLCLSPPPFSRGAQNWWFIMLVRDLVYSLSESDFRISFSERYHVSSNSAECLYHTNFKSPSNNHLSVLLEATAIWSGMLAVLYVLRILMWPWPDPRSRSLTSWSSENCTFLRLSPPLFWRGTHNWWVITRVWDQVYSFSEPHFWIFSPLDGHVTKSCYCRNPLRFFSTLADARSLWLWFARRPCQAVHTGGDDHQPLAGLF